MKIYKSWSTCHTLFQRAMTWVSYDLGDFQYVGSSLANMWASTEKWRSPIPQVSHRVIGILGEHKLRPLAAVLQLLNMDAEGSEEFINHVRKTVHLYGHLWSIGVCVCVYVYMCLSQDSSALLSSTLPKYGVIKCSAYHTWFIWYWGSKPCLCDRRQAQV